MGLGPVARREFEHVFDVQHLDLALGSNTQCSQGPEDLLEQQKSGVMPRELGHLHDRKMFQVLNVKHMFKDS